VDYTSDPQGLNVRVDFDGSRLGEFLEKGHGEAGENERKVGEDGKVRGVRWSK
jgi:hypothetical protein